MNAADLSVAAAVKSCIPEIAKTIDLISERVRKGGRVIYIGAGTSGRLNPRAFLGIVPLITPLNRLGILDASEM
jgi:N-acetylmuramic acid 6-phosphate (MurNAc-6-P) etherase